MFHVTCYGWLIFRARIGGPDWPDDGQPRSAGSQPASVDVHGLLVPLLAFTLPLVVVHACEAYYDDVLVVPRLPAVVRYSVYAAAFYLTLLFGNFGGAEFIYFQF
jgi:alginate O-acetyltransferase complex protein AlgI